MKSLFWRLGLALVLLLTLGGVLGARSIQAAEAPWLSGWANRLPLTIDHTRIAANLTDYPVLVHLSAASGLTQANTASVFTALGTNRLKLAVTTSDGVSQCYGEVVRWDSTNKQAYLWVKVPSLSSTVDTTLYLYFDNAHSDNSSYIGLTGSTPAQQVWDSNFVAVYHLAEQGSGASGEYKDSTSHHNNGTSTGPLPPDRVTDSPNGFAQQFDGPSANWNGHNRLITVPDANDFSLTTTGKLTISYWIKPTAWNMPGNDNVPPQSGEGRLGIMGKSAYGGNDEWLINLHNNAAVAGQYWDTFYNFNLAGSYGAGSKIDLGSSTTTWHYSVSHALWTGSASTSYNDQYKGDPTPWSDSHREPFSVFSGIAPGNGTAPLEIGGMTRYSGSGHDYFTGLFAEIRFSNIQRSDAWGRADYYAQSDVLISYGMVSSQGGSIPTATPTPTPTSTSTPTPTPITASTFGLNSGTDAWSDTGSVLNAMRFQNNAGSGTLTKMELLYSTSAPVGKVRLGVYADNNGKPGTRLLDAGEANVASGWVGITNLRLPVTANTYYWLSFNQQTTNAVSFLNSSYNTSQAYHYWANGTPYGALPAAFNLTNAGSNLGPYVMRATVSPTTAATPIVRTFGLSNGNSLWNQSANILDAMRYYNIAGSGTLTKLSLLVKDTTPVGKVRMGVYADNNGRPGARLLDAGETYLTNGWVTIANLNLTVNANTYYWLAFEMQSGNSVVYQSGQSTGSHYWVSQSYGTLPVSYPVSGLSTNNSPYVMYATVVRY